MLSATVQVCEERVTEVVDSVKRLNIHGVDQNQNMFVFFSLLVFLGMFHTTYKMPHKE